MNKPAIIQTKVSLKEYNSWKVGGEAEYLAEPVNLDELKACVSWAANENHPMTVLSSGTNVLISDKGIRGLVLCLRKLVGLEVNETSERLQLVAWAGTPKSELLKVLIKYKLAPALFLAGLPGDVGGGVVMNAGVSEPDKSPREFCEITDWIEVLRYEDNQFQLLRFDKDQIKWEYRHSSGWQPGIIVRAAMSWPNQADTEVVNKIRQATRKRISTQPLDLPSCGSVFRNPPGHKSGALIEQSGLKGFTLGGAQVSTKHSNFIVNINSASAADVHQIIEHVKATVKDQQGIDLQTEVVYLGDW